MAAVASPLTLLREYVVALRALLAGDRVTAEGRHVRLDGVALDHPPQQPLPVQVGGAGPKTLRLAGEVGDGTVLGSGAITSVVVQPTSGEQDLEGFVRMLGSDVRPALVAD